jgi:glycosyltransferase involved in cell wall biosynthesis
MKIGFDFRMGGSVNAGIGRYSFELLTHMLTENQNDHFVVFYHEQNNNPDDIARLKELGAELVVANFRHYSFGEQLLFPRLLKKYNLDLVHFPNFNVPIFYNQPFVVTIHDMVHHKISGQKKSRLWKYYAYEYVIKQAAAKAKKIITVTEAAKKEIIDYLAISAEKIKVIYEAPTSRKVEASEVEKVKEKFLLSRPYFLFVGTLERKKNLPMLTKAFDFFLKKYKYDMDMVIAGKPDPHYPEIRDQAMDIAHRDRLVLTGFVEEADQAALYQGAYAFVTASLHEGFGLPGLEAMMYGVPVLASNTEVFNEVYDNGAIYFDPLNPEDIAAQMNLIVKDSQFHSQMQQKSVERAHLFDWAETATRTLALYHESMIKNYEPENEIEHEIENE